MRFILGKAAHLPLHNDYQQPAGYYSPTPHILNTGSNFWHLQRMLRRTVAVAVILVLTELPVAGSSVCAGKTTLATPVFNTLDIAVSITEFLDETGISHQETPSPDEPLQSQASPNTQEPQDESHQETGENPSADAAEIIAGDFPQVDTGTSEYTVFRDEITAIIREAERLSGIKTVYGVFVMDLLNNYICGVNESLTRVDPYDNMREGYFNSASVVKLFQAYILCDMMRMGELSMDETYYDKVTGRRFRLTEMINAMLSYSDNNYSNAALRLVGNQKSNEVLDRLGIHDSRIYGEMSGAIGYSAENNLKRYGTVKRCARITPRDTGLILYNVYLNRESDIYMEMLDKALKANIYNTRIPAGVARVNPEYEVAHKTGTNTELGIYNDAGIIYCRRPFILVALTQSTTARTGESFIRILAEKLTRYFDSKAVTEEDAPLSISSDSRQG